MSLPSLDLDQRPLKLLMQQMQEVVEAGLLVEMQQAVADPLQPWVADPVYRRHPDKHNTTHQDPIGVNMHYGEEQLYMTIS